MKPSDQTSIGGPNQAFETTRWIEILDMRRCSRDEKRALMEPLLTRYWKPVYCYLRRKGHDNESAKDLTQGFFEEVVLGRGLFRRADPVKGRFRTFLLAALNRYVVSVHRAATARKRRPARGLVPLEQVDPGTVPRLAEQVRPDEVFDYAWASNLLDEVLAEVEAECRCNNMATHWELFAARVLRPIINRTDPPPLRELCVLHGINNPQKISNMLVRVKRRFRAALERHIRRLVGSDDEVPDEINDLMKILSRAGAR